MMMQYNKNEILNYKRPNISSEIKKIERKKTIHLLQCNLAVEEVYKLLKGEL